MVCTDAHQNWFNHQGGWGGARSGTRDWISGHPDPVPRRIFRGCHGGLGRRLSATRLPTVVGRGAGRRKRMDRRRPGGVRVVARPSGCARRVSVWGNFFAGTFHTGSGVSDTFSSAFCGTLCHDNRHPGIDLPRCQTDTT